MAGRTRRYRGQLFAALLFGLLPASGCVSKPADPGGGPDGPPTPLVNGVAGCVAYVTCHPGVFVEACAYLYELERMRASPTLAAAIDAYHACLAQATSCAEVDACTGTECSTEEPTCDGADRLVCYKGRWVRIPCGEPGSGGTTCLQDNLGTGVCADRACTAGDPVGGACSGSVRSSCDGGLLTHHDCRAEYSEPACVDDGFAAYCDVLRTANPCQTGVRAYCAGNVLVRCDGGVEVRYDCGYRPFTSSCVASGGDAACLSHPGATLCTSPSTCDGSELQLCFGEQLPVDCSRFGAGCVSFPPTAACVF